MKKVLTTFISGVSIIAMLCVPVFATALFQSSGHTGHLPGSDNWNRGIKSSGKGYYMAYSYYYNSKYTHASKAGLPNSTATVSQNYAPGATSVANSKSRPSYNSAVIGAGTYNGSWRYVRDNGSGDRLVTSW